MRNELRIAELEPDIFAIDNLVLAYLVGLAL